MAQTAAIMFQGTGSDVGKSLIVAGLCRAFARKGMKVRPFKPQNMSNNAAVTADGGEIGRAQALQARACGVPPSRHMNPVLLKPQSETGAQVIVQGEIFGNAKAADYHRLKPQLLAKVLESYRILRAEADLVLVEGAGSPAEVNLRQGDIANMGFALAAAIPVVLVGDIDRGGVIASLVGTKALLAPQEAARVKGFLINKFRGDLALFADGVYISDFDHRFADLERPIKDQGIVKTRVRIGRDVWLGTKVTVCRGVRIGDGVVVGANAVVTRDLPDHAVAVGVPARVIKDRRRLDPPSFA